MAGTPVAFRDVLRTEQGRYLGQLDNVLTAAMLVYLFELGFSGHRRFLPPRKRPAAAGVICWNGSVVSVVPPTSWWWWIPVPIRMCRPANEQLLVLRHSDANATFNAELTNRLA